MAMRIAAIPAGVAVAILLLVCVVGTAGASDTAPSNLTLTPVSDTVQLDWTKANDSAYNKAHIIGFWKSGEPGNATAALVTGGLNSVKFPPGILEPDTPYKFEVFSVKTDEDGTPLKDPNRNNDYIYGGSTNVVSHTTGKASDSEPEPTKPPKEPDPPTTPNATDFTISQSGSSAVLKWTPGNDSRITYQRIMRKTPGSTWTAIRVDGDTGTYTDSDMEKGKKYIYRIESWSAKNKKIGVSKRAKITLR